jgi:hypothetical protein
VLFKCTTVVLGPLVEKSKVERRTSNVGSPGVADSIRWRYD